jgi:hypothetical protein
VHTEFVPEEAKTFPPTQSVCCKVGLAAALELSTVAKQTPLSGTASSSASHPVAATYSWAPATISAGVLTHTVANKCSSTMFHCCLTLRNPCLHCSLPSKTKTGCHLPGRQPHHQPGQKVQVPCRHPVQPTGISQDGTDYQPLLRGKFALTKPSLQSLFPFQICSGLCSASTAPAAAAATLLYIFSRRWIQRQ